MQRLKLGLETAQAEVFYLFTLHYAEIETDTYEVIKGFRKKFTLHYAEIETQLRTRLPFDNRNLHYTMQRLKPIPVSAIDIAEAKFTLHYAEIETIARLYLFILI